MVLLKVRFSSMVSFFSPIYAKSDHEKCSMFRMTSHFFDFGQRSFTILDKDPHCVIERIASKPSWVGIAVRIIAILTIVIPLFCVIGNLIYRLANQFRLAENDLGQIPPEILKLIFTKAGPTGLALGSTNKEYFNLFKNDEYINKYRALNLLETNYLNARLLADSSEKLICLASIALTFAKFDSPKAEALVEEVIGLLNNPELDNSLRCKAVNLVLQTLPLLPAHNFERYTDYALAWPATVKKNSRSEIKVNLIKALATLNPQKAEEIADQLTIADPYRDSFYRIEMASAFVKTNPQKAEKILIKAFELLDSHQNLHSSSWGMFVEKISKVIKKLNTENTAKIAKLVLTKIDTESEYWQKNGVFRKFFNTVPSLDFETKVKLLKFIADTQSPYYITEFIKVLPPSDLQKDSPLIEQVMGQKDMYPSYIVKTLFKSFVKIDPHYAAELVQNCIIEADQQSQFDQYHKEITKELALLDFNKALNTVNALQTPHHKFYGLIAIAQILSDSQQAKELVEKALLEIDLVRVPIFVGYIHIINEVSSLEEQEVVELIEKAMKLEIDDDWNVAYVCMNIAKNLHKLAPAIALKVAEGLIQTANACREDFNKYNSLKYIAVGICGLDIERAIQIANSLRTRSNKISILVAIAENLRISDPENAKKAIDLGLKMAKSKKEIKIEDVFEAMIQVDHQMALEEFKKMPQDNKKIIYLIETLAALHLPQELIYSVFKAQNFQFQMQNFNKKDFRSHIINLITPTHPRQAVLLAKTIKDDYERFIKLNEIASSFT